VIVLVAAAIALVVVGLTTSSSDGTQRIKGPVPYTVLTLVPGQTNSSPTVTSSSGAAPTSAATSDSASPSTFANSYAPTNGAFDFQVIAAAGAAGYLMAVSTHTGSLDDPKALFATVRREVPAFMSLGSIAKLVQ
jgi:hypothetical protein